MRSIHRSRLTRTAILEAESEVRPSPRRTRVLATCLGFAVLSAFTSVVCLWQTNDELSLRKLSNESRGWPSATGEIVDAILVRSGGRGPAVIASVRYRFVVGTKTFEGHTLSFERPRSTAAESAVRRFRPGTPVRAFFRPSDPGLSVLERDSWAGWPRVASFAAVGVCGALVSVMLLRVSIRVAHGIRPAFSRARA
jgi:hypothetical protein